MTQLKIDFPKLDQIEERLENISSRLDEIQDNSNVKTWLSNSEACAFLDVTPRTMQKYRDEGILSFSKIGAKIYYKFSDLQRHLEANLQEAFNKRKGGKSC